MFFILPSNDLYVWLFLNRFSSTCSFVLVFIWWFLTIDSYWLIIWNCESISYDWYMMKSVLIIRISILIFLMELIRIEFTFVWKHWIPVFNVNIKSNGKINLIISAWDWTFWGCESHLWKSICCWVVVSSDVVRIWFQWYH